MMFKVIIYHGTWNLCVDIVHFCNEIMAKFIMKKFHHGPFSVELHCTIDITNIFYIVKT